MLHRIERSISISDLGVISACSASLLAESEVRLPQHCCRSGILAEWQEWFFLVQ